MELARLEGLPSISSSSPSSSATHPLANNPRHVRRFAHVKTYLTSQHKILLETTQLLEAALLRSMAITPKTSAATAAAAAAFANKQHHPPTPTPLITLPYALHTLRALNPPLHKTFRTALLTLYGTSSTLKIRANFPGEEENIWTMFLAILPTALAATLRDDPPSAAGAEARTEEEEGQPPATRLEARTTIHHWLNHLKSIGHDLLLASSSSSTSPTSPSSTATTLPQNDQDPHQTTHILSLVHAIHSASSSAPTDDDNNIFNPTHWPQQLVLACVRAVREESVRVSFRAAAAGAGGLMEGEEDEEEEEDDQGEEDGEGERDEGDGSEEKQNGVDVVCMYLGGDEHGGGE